MGYRIESDFKMESDWLPAAAFAQQHETQAGAIAMAIESVEDPREQEVRVTRVDTGEVVWRSTEAQFE